MNSQTSFSLCSKWSYTNCWLIKASSCMLTSIIYMLMLKPFSVNLCHCCKINISLHMIHSSLYWGFILRQSCKNTSTRCFLMSNEKNWSFSLTSFLVNWSYWNLTLSATKELIHVKNIVDLLHKQIFLIWVQLEWPCNWN